MPGKKSVAFGGTTRRGSTVARSIDRTANKALRIANRGKVIAARNAHATKSPFQASNVPAIKYLQPPDATSFRQTILKMIARIYVEQDVNSTVIDDFRIDIVLDRAPTGLPLSIENVYNTVTPRITHDIKQNDRDRYKLVKSFTGGFGKGGATSRAFSFKVRSGLRVECTSNVPSQAAVQKNAYYIVYWTSSTVNTPKITYDILVQSQTA